MVLLTLLVTPSSRRVRRSSTTRAGCTIAQVKKYGLIFGIDAMIRVVIRDNQGTQWTFASEGDEIVIGRVTQKMRDEIVLPKKNISRKHCRLFRDGDDVLVEDMGSVNGTWVNREKRWRQGALTHR